MAYSINDPLYQQNLDMVRQARPEFQGMSYAKIDTILKQENAAALENGREFSSGSPVKKGQYESTSKQSQTTNATATKQSEQANKNNTNRKSQKTEEGSYRYPLKQIEKGTDYLEIQILKYQPPGITSQDQVLTQGLVTSTESINQQKEILKTIYLPIPQNIQDANAVGWGEDSLNSIAAYGLGLSKDVIKSGDILGGIAGAGSQLIKDLEGITVSGGAQDLAQSYFASRAVNVLGANTSLEGILARSSGQILNPNMELLFKEVKLRSFNFEFDLAPRSGDEAMIVKKIIRSFKINMVPSTTAALNNDRKGLFIQAPNVFQLSYKQGSNPHPFLNRFKPMALVNMSVNYTGSGTYATYSDATPVHMKLALSFQELNPIYAEDYNEDIEGVGY